MDNINFYSKEVRGQLLLRGIISGISIWIEMLRQYAEEVESCLIKKIEQYELLINSEEDIIEKQQLEMFSELYRSSLFITCYSFFEFELSLICNTLCNQYNLSIKIDNYKKGRAIPFIRRMIEYLKNVCKLNLPSDSKYIQHIFIYSKLRNNISHNAGRLVQNYEEIKTFINENEPKITLNDYGLIILTKDFVFDAITTFDSFFNEFYQAFSSWITSPTS